MPCYKPVTAWYSAHKNASGRRPLVFSASGGFGLPLQVPCGQCIGCRLERARQWAIRCTHENQLHEESCFLTLTYAPENLPEHGRLVKRDLQLFLKRLRRSLPVRLRYFACGEYGERLGRPHYHLLLFGWAFLSDRRRHSLTAFGSTYKSESLNKLWGLGECVIGNVSMESAGYVARYSVEKINGALAEKHYTRLDCQTGELVRLPSEFVAMSLKPGIGSVWFERFSSDVFPDDFVIQKGRKLRVPKYYDAKLSAHELELLKSGRRLRARQHSLNNTPARLAVREEVTRSKVKLLTRKNHEG